MYRAGAYVAENVEPVAMDAVQPNGVDLTVEAVFEQSTPGHIGQSGKEIGERERLDADDGVFHLQPGGYILRYSERISIPEGHVGFVYPRSSLMRNSGMLNTAVWDAGYEGRGEGLLQLHHEITLEQGARVAQLVLAEADHKGTYDGSYQGENL